MQDQPFMPKYGSGQTVTPGAASANITIGLGNRNLSLVNSGANLVYIRVGIGAQTATAADFALRPGETRVISKDPLADSLAHLAATGTSTLSVIPGEGWY